jgi:hypothetical protein
VPKSSRSSPDPIPPARPESVIVAAAEAAPHLVRSLPYGFTGSLEREVPHRREKRPTLGIALYGTADDPLDSAIASARAIVDSGADNTTLSADWADLLGIDLERDCAPIRPIIAGPQKQAGEEQEVTHYAYGGGLWVEILGTKLLLPVVMFCKGLPRSLLGRRDFFVKYLVAFDERNARFFLERLPEIVDDDDDELDVVAVAS